MIRTKTPIGTDYRDAIAIACQSMENASEEPDLQTLAQAAGMSPSHFHRIFKSLTGVTPKAYAMSLRAKRMQRDLADSESVTEAIYKAGFHSSGRFYETSSKTLGMTPKAFRAGGKGATIRFAVGECSLGCILVAASRIGVCAITFGDDPAALVRDLEDRFPQAQLLGGDADFETLVGTVIAFVEHPSADWSLPLDIRGTAFQQRVWQALRKIPLGQTASYADIAKSIGHPSAVRAVAQACGANSIAVVIPCHRVVRTDGSLSGYRWGIERKAALLKRERGKE